MAELSDIQVDIIAPSSEGVEVEIDHRELDRKLIERAKKCLELAKNAEHEIRESAREDINFSIGKQWPDEIENERKLSKRPCLTINRIAQFIQQVTNDQRQNRPAIKVHPVNNGADEDTAKIIQGLIRHIEYNSNAEVAYDTAFDSAARGGFGFWRINTDYVDPQSFDQDIFIKRIPNQFSVYLDPNSKEPDGSDAEWALIIAFLDKDVYADKYPDSELASLNWQTIGNQAPSWMSDGSTCIAEFFYKEYEEKTIHLLKTGISVFDEDLQQSLMEAQAAGIDASVQRTRTTKVPVVKWVKINAVEVLERTTWPGKYIPIVPVYGNEIYVDNERVLESVIRHSKDPQRMLNYWASAETEAIALAPRTPFIIAEGQIEGYEEQWKSANVKNHAFLPYKVASSQGQLVPPPQRQAFEPAVQAITNARMMAADDLKSTTGFYDSAIGAQSNEVAGVAIQRRASQSQMANFHFVDNLTRSMRHTGRILVDLIPKIYDTERTSRIVGEDGTHSVVTLNAPYKDENGKELLYKLDTGTYDVTIDVGPSYATKREEAAVSMQQILSGNPQLMGIVGDLMVKNMDWPGAQEMADRLKKTLPPGLADDPNLQDIPPQVQAQLQQMDQMIGKLMKNLDEAEKVIETKQLELTHRERIEIYKTQVNAEIEMAKLGSKDAIALLEAKLTEMEHRLKYLMPNQPIQAPGLFNAENADGGNYAGIGHIGGTENLTGEDSPGLSMEHEP